MGLRVREAARVIVARAEEPWLGRFVDARLLAQGAGIERRSAREEESGAPRLVLVAKGPQAARLNEAARVLSLLDHPNVPVVVAQGFCADVTWLALDCDAASDLDELFCTQAAAHRKLSVSASWALAERWLDVLIHAHARLDPASGRPICLGNFTWSNVIVTSEGVPQFLGFGDDLYTEPGQLSTHVVRAPEVAAGALPWPGGDLWALLTLFHSLLPLRELPPVVARVLQGAAVPDDAEVRARLRGLHASILCEPEDRTRDARWVQDSYRALWSELDLRADEPALCAFLREGLARARQDLASPRAGLHVVPELEIEADASAFRVRGGARVDLSARHVARRLLAALLQADGAALSTHALLSAGWPGERMRTDAGVHRVHVGLHQLRRLGLGGLLVHGEHGYRLACRVVPSSIPV